MAGLKAVILILFLAESAYADVGLICTLRGEKDQILKVMENTEKINKSEREFYIGVLDGAKVVLVRSPMGKVNNAITAQLLASNFNIDMIVSIGFAGAIEESLKIGDVVVSTKAMQHDFGTIKPYGFIWGKSPEIGESGEINPERWTASKGYSYGTIVSGDQFIASDEKREWLKKRFDALAVDTGAAAIYEVCKQNGIKCIFIRVISDSADIEGRINFNSSVQSGNYRSINAVREFLREYYDRRQ